MSSLRLGAALAAAVALAGCTTTPSQDPLPEPPVTAASASAPPARGAAAAPAPSPRDDPSDPKVACERVHTIAFPPADLPTPDEQKALAGCDAEALYYGIDRPADFAAARRCAYAQRDDKKAPALGGAPILLMVYANGKGVPVSFDLAMRFACEDDSAPAERAARVSSLISARRAGKLEKDLDYCDDITSSFWMGWCRRHEERLEGVGREARKQAATKGLPAAALARLDEAAEAFIAARALNEVDLSGTMRGVFSIEERSRLREDYVAMLEKLADPAFTPPAGDAAQAERDLQKTYDDLMRCKKEAEPIDELRVGAKKILKTELLWLAYREAWLSLVAEARPSAKRGAWKAWLTEKRTKMLRDLAAGCP